MTTVGMLLLITISGQKTPPTRQSFLPKSTVPPHLCHPPSTRPQVPHPPSATFVPLHPNLTCTSQPYCLIQRYVHLKYQLDLLELLFQLTFDHQVAPYSPLVPSYHHLTHLAFPAHEVGALLRIHHIPFPGWLDAFCE